MKEKKTYKRHSKGFFSYFWLKIYIDMHVKYSCTKSHSTLYLFIKRFSSKMSMHFMVECVKYNNVSCLKKWTAYSEKYYW